MTQEKKDLTCLANYQDFVITTKKCSKCAEVKPTTEFYKRKDKKDGLTSWCKICFSQMGKIYREKNILEYKKKARKCHKRYRENHPEKNKYSGCKKYISQIIQLLNENKFLISSCLSKKLKFASQKFIHLFSKHFKLVDKRSYHPQRISKKSQELLSSIGINTYIYVLREHKPFQIEFEALKKDIEEKNFSLGTPIDGRGINIH